MVMTYFYSQLIPVKYNFEGYLIVLASGNIDKALVGYDTKYDCGSGDLNPLGSINKLDANNLINYLAELYPHLTALKDIVNAQPLAELTPVIPGEKIQSAEDAIRLTYKEIKMFNELRNQELCGIVSMYEQACDFMPDVSPADVKEKVLRFFTRYFRNRHKSTILTPGVHLSGNSVEDSRYDHRPFVYESRGERPFEYQWEKVDSICENRLKHFNSNSGN